MCLCVCLCVCVCLCMIGAVPVPAAAASPVLFGRPGHHASRREELQRARHELFNPEAGGLWDGEGGEQCG
jgi:hypothetical protein